ncbi:hypothetical protein [Streptomyces sp. NPDC021096]|uniref:hypothetical protein n=1 Tax=Streptomyces sp. NPDC021096 TaxID=3154792 RepID=UPI00340A1F91
MAVSVSAVFILLVIVIMLMRFGYIRGGSAIVCILLGFFLASTGLAPAINQSAQALAHALGAIRL